MVVLCELGECVTLETQLSFHSCCGLKILSLCLWCLPRQNPAGMAVVPWGYPLTLSFLTCLQILLGLEEYLVWGHHTGPERPFQFLQGELKPGSMQAQIGWWLGRADTGISAGPQPTSSNIAWLAVFSSSVLDGRRR